MTADDGGWAVDVCGRVCNRRRSVCAGFVGFAGAMRGCCAQARGVRRTNGWKKPGWNRFPAGLFVLRKPAGQTVIISFSFFESASSSVLENFSSSFCVRISTTFSGRPFRTNCHIEAAAGSILHFILLFLPEDKFRHGQTAFRHGSDGILDNTRHAHKSSHSNRKISS